MFPTVHSAMRHVTDVGHVHYSYYWAVRRVLPAMLVGAGAGDGDGDGDGSGGVLL